MRKVGAKDCNMTGIIPTEFGLLEDFDTNLTTHNFTGTIPIELGNTKVLNKLYLFDNRLNGTAPSELGSLDVLWYLDISPHALTGTLPREHSQLYKLKWL